MYELREEDRRAWLDLFPRLERATASNRFLFEVRKDRRYDVDVLDAVVGEVHDRVQRLIRNAHWYTPDHLAEEAAKLKRFRAALDDHPDVALAFARYCIAYEALPEDEREKVKTGHRSAAMRAVMEEQPATDRQKEFLRDGFRYRGDLDALTKQKASDLISRFKAEKQRQRL